MKYNARYVQIFSMIWEEVVEADSIEEANEILGREIGEGMSPTDNIITGGFFETALLEDE